MSSIGAILYFLMKILPLRFFQRSMWFVLRKVKLTSALTDEWYYKLHLLACTGERYRLPWDGGGINSIIAWQQIYWKSGLELMAKCSDKIAVRDFVRSRMGETGGGGI